MYLWFGLCPKPAGRAYSTPPNSLAGREGLAARSSRTSPPLSAFARISALRASEESPKRHGFREQSKFLQRIPLHWKGWKTLYYARYDGVFWLRFILIFKPLLPWYCRFDAWKAMQPEKIPTPTISNDRFGEPVSGYSYSKSCSNNSKQFSALVQLNVCPPLLSVMPPSHPKTVCCTSQGGARSSF